MYGDYDQRTLWVPTPNAAATVLALQQLHLQLLLTGARGHRYYSQEHSACLL